MNNSWNIPVSPPVNTPVRTHTSMNMNNNNNFGAYNSNIFSNDPFADIDKMNTGASLSLNMSQPKSNNQFSFGESTPFNLGSAQNYNINNNMNTNFGYANISNPNPSTNANTFSFDMGMGLGSTNVNTNNKSNSSFDLI